MNNYPVAYEDSIIAVGAKENYEARCRHCHEVPSRAETHTLTPAELEGGA